MIKTIDVALYTGGVAEGRSNRSSPIMRMPTCSAFRLAWAEALSCGCAYGHYMVVILSLSVISNCTLLSQDQRHLHRTLRPRRACNSLLLTPNLDRHHKNAARVVRWSLRLHLRSATGLSIVLTYLVLHSVPGSRLMATATVDSWRLIYGTIVLTSCPDTTTCSNSYS